MKSILFLLTATSCMVTPLAVTAQNPVRLATFLNPTPAAEDRFGIGMAALRNDRILIGAPYDDTTATNAGTVYLFHTNGTLLTIFTNPHPTISYSTLGDLFGNAISTLGNDLVLIGAPYEGKVYLFTTNGSPVKTIAPSSQSDRFSFGAAVTAFGSDRVLIGAPEANLDIYTYDPYGTAYLFSTNGALLATFQNPDPNQTSELGSSVAAFGSDRVLIGASGYYPGAAYLFNTNGIRLMTFTNPAPSAFDYFGRGVAVVGTDRVLVGADGNDMTTTNAGAVYLFNTNGTLLLTIANPTPAVDDYFGAGVAVLGNDRVVIGAQGDDATGPNSGSAYVFDLSGTLLATINNPTPGVGDNFGSCLAAVGNDSVLIGATGHNGVGAAYLFNIPAAPVTPLLAIRRTTTNTVVVSWPSPSTGFVLQQNTDGVSSVNWSNVTDSLQNDGTNQTLIVNPTNGSRLYRLVSPQENL